MPNQLLINQEKEHQLTLFKNIAEEKFTRILGDPGADSGSGKVGTGEEKSRAKRKAPGENVSPDLFLTVKPVLASDWVPPKKRNFSIFLANQRAANL